jgi:hypothetical protein
MSRNHPERPNSAEIRVRREPDEEEDDEEDESDDDEEKNEDGDQDDEGYSERASPYSC